jgi:MFS family permease
VASIVLRTIDPARSTLGGSLALAAGLAVTVAAIDTRSTGWFFVGTVIAGFGFGASFLGAFRTVAMRVGAADRAATLAAVLVVAYAGFSVPTVIAGFVATHIGLRDTALGYGAAVIVVSLTAVVLQGVRAATARRADPYTQLLALAPTECQATTTTD